MLPNQLIFPLEQFAPDLSKLYSLHSSYQDQMNQHLKQRSACNRLSQIETKGREVNMFLIWMMIWILGKPEHLRPKQPSCFCVAFEYLDDAEK